MWRVLAQQIGHPINEVINYSTLSWSKIQLSFYQAIYNESPLLNFYAPI